MRRVEDGVTIMRRVDGIGDIIFRGCVGRVLVLLYKALVRF